MKLVEELYAMYRNHLTGDEEDLYEVVMGALDEHERTDLEKTTQQLSDEQYAEMVKYYILELLRRKIAEEGIGNINMKTNARGDLLH
ncbi:DUF6154 family protein [Pseudalkalibacillus caeni]|uniref:Cytosolic protein n=1 Tax=Exobacillus caeni TaxID=2574798 RepID=A0A5R9F820_9BACL|nr:DUF6154 family protein [Pseudalkalibacillus caeni]TLS38476.1 hypothetical protein FCL54_04885 [Pseudalkalibacillus caeni]